MDGVSSISGAFQLRLASVSPDAVSKKRMSINSGWGSDSGVHGREALWKGYYVVNDGSGTFTQAGGQRVRRSTQ